MIQVSVLKKLRVWWKCCKEKKTWTIKQDKNYDTVTQGTGHKPTLEGKGWDQKGFLEKN